MLAQDLFVRHQCLILPGKHGLSRVRRTLGLRDLGVLAHLSVNLVDFHAIVHFLQLMHVLHELREVLVVVIANRARLLLHELVSGGLERVRDRRVARRDDFAQDLEVLRRGLRHQVHGSVVDGSRCAFVLLRLVLSLDRAFDSLGVRLLLFLDRFQACFPRLVHLIADLLRFLQGVQVLLLFVYFIAFVHFLFCILFLSILTGFALPSF